MLMYFLMERTNYILIFFYSFCGETDYLKNIKLKNERFRKYT